MATRQPPRFTGVHTYRDPQGRFSVRFPTDWHTFELSDNRDGFMVSPEAENPQTWFAIWLMPLEHAVVAEDMEDLQRGVEEGLAQLPECNVEAASNDNLSNLLKFERIFTFRDGDAVRKRKLWILYVDKWMYVLTFQGANVEEYHYWLAMVNYSYDTFTLPEALWFATDRDLSRYRQA